MPTIPISQIIQMRPGVIGGGGTPSLLSGLVVSQDSSIPPSQILSFFNATDVSAWFGPSAPETTIANNYFPGIINGGQLPYVLKFARYAPVALTAGSYGAKLGTLTLAQLQAFTGTLVVTTSALFLSSSINLSAATSFANAATIMTAAFTSPDFAITYDATRGRFLLLTTGTGSAITCSDVTGTLASNVGLSQASGAFIQTAGVAADTPATAMTRVTAIDTDWGGFTTSYAAVIADRLAYSVWNSGQNYQFWYVGWDSEPAGRITNNASSYGAQVFAAPYQGTTPLYGGLAQAGQLLGYAASINFNVPNGRTTLAFRQFASGTPGTVNTLADANALLSNKYTYVGSYANQANTFTISYAGALSGAFLWADTYLNQIYLNRALQLAFFTALLAFNSIPYNADGYTQLYQSVVDVPNAAVISGIIRQGVTLSQSQIQLINTQAGRNIADIVQTRGWYLLIGDPANVAQVRQTRDSPQVTLWYTDGGSVQKLNVGSTAII